jgi:ribulose-bisphosphate carboxylase small chain
VRPLRLLLRRSMYKLPMFGCTDASQVLKEIDNATRQFPECYVRMAAFDPDRQVQVAAMLVHRPSNVKDYR